MYTFRYASIGILSAYYQNLARYDDAGNRYQLNSPSLGLTETKISTGEAEYSSVVDGPYSDAAIQYYTESIYPYPPFQIVW